MPGFGRHLTLVARASGRERPGRPSDASQSGGGASVTRDPSGNDESSEQERVVRGLVEQHAGALYRLALSIVHDPALAEDVVQESFIRGWKALPDFRGEAPLRHWLLKIAHNTAVSTLRVLREEPRDPAQLPHGPGEDVERVVHARLAVTAALERLDPMSRSIVELREVEGLSYEEIATVLEIPQSTVKTRLFRARRRLREDLGRVQK